MDGFLMMGIVFSARNASTAGRKAAQQAINCKLSQKVPRVDPGHKSVEALVEAYPSIHD
jgi:hypothetical protein